jgi:hypothetical protein
MRSLTVINRWFVVVKIVFALFVLTAISLLLYSCTDVTDVPQAESIPALSNEELIKRGEYLVITSACHDCHSPKVMTEEGPMPDTSRLLSGHPKNDPVPVIPGKSAEWILFSQDLTTFVGPWGVSYSANLTPHATGTESWTFEQFKTAIRKGKYKGMEGSRNLLPPMPWQMYRTMSDEDLNAIFTYLKSLKPVDNLVPPPIPAEDLKLD